MPLQTNLNTNPYFDDYDPNNLYYRVLFKPAQAVQARELTQLQSILQNQVETFGNWAFQNGDIVSGCQITDIPNLAYVRVADVNSVNGAYLDPSQYVNTQLVSVSSNLTARVIYGTQGFTPNYPATNIFYVIYTNTGTGGQQTFSNTDILNVVNIASNSVITTVAAWANSTTNTTTIGTAHGISVDKGVAFLNGVFVKVLQPTIGIVNAYGTNAGNSYVGFILNETIVNSDEDASLLDNALGYENQNAPGADRLKLQVGLMAISNVALLANSANFNPIATYNFGTMISTSTSSSNLYSIVGNAIAQRVYDESGNFVVNPFSVDTITSANSLVSNLSSNNALARISPGSGYAQGQEVAITKTAYINMRRGVDTLSKTSQIITFNYGSYFICDEYSLNVTPGSTLVYFYNKPQLAITNRTFGSSTTPVGTQIGSGLVRCITLLSGTPGTNTATYAIHVYNISMTAGYNVNQIASVYLSGSGSADLSVSGLQESGNDDYLFSYNVSGLKSLRNASNTNNTEFVYRTRSTITLALTGNSGSGSYTLPTGNDYLQFGTGTLSDINAANFIVINSANAQSAALTGTVSINSGNTLVTGSGTVFTNAFSIGSQILVGSAIRTVVSVSNSTVLNVDAAFPTTASGQTYYKYYPAGKAMNIAALSYDRPSTISISNTTTFAVNMTFNGNTVPTGALTLKVIYNVLRTTAVAANKVINKNRFVRIDTTGNPSGPWSLGFSDVHNVTAVYGCTTPTYTTSGALVTQNFVFDSGGTDTTLGLGYLYPSSTTSSSATPYLLVQLDYFSVNTASGGSFFTVESYPIDDTNTANVNAIQTQNIPVYVDGSGNPLWLRDYVDFRLPTYPTANDTGYCDTTNSAQITTAISYSSLVNTANPLTTATYYTGFVPPAWGQNLQADYTIYLPRYDLLYITPTASLNIKEGVSSVNPQPPLFPDNAMALSVLQVPAYPSLTTDQIDALSTTNKKSKNLIRYTGNAIKTSLVTNRRYTMADVGKLDQRITNLEYYVSLNLLQQSAQNLTVTDANGLDRFKNGIFADPFNDFTYSAVSDPAYSIAIDNAAGIARPKFIREALKVKFNSGTSVNIQQTGRLLTLPYTEAQFLSQPYATEYRSAALVAFSWLGTLQLIPTYDSHIDTSTTGSAQITINNVTAWAEFANTPFGSTYGDWRTTTTTTTNTVITSTNNTTTSSAPAKQPSLVYTGIGSQSGGIGEVNYGFG